MRWYEKLYVGEKAKKHRYAVIQAIREGKKTGYYVLTLPSNGKNVLDIYPALSLQQPYYQKQDMLIVGIASDRQDAAELAGRIVAAVYKKTGGFDVKAFLEREVPEREATEREAAEREATERENPEREASGRETPEE